MNPHSQDEGRGPGPMVGPQDPAEFPKFSRRRRCCGHGVQLVLVGLATTLLWAGLLALLLFWHWDTVQNLKQLEVTAARNVSRVAKDLERHNGDRMAQKAQAAQVSQNMEEIQAEQKRMKAQDSELSRSLEGLRSDLSNLKSLSLNERHTALHSLERLQEEVVKLWIELHTSNGSLCNMCPEKWVNFQRKCYYFGEGPKRWIQARFACSKLRGRLVSIHSQEEQDFLVRHANRKGTWIGLRDLDREGEFIWMDQGPLNYSNWRPGEPNNGGQGEDCVMMQGSGEWNDAFCGSRLDGWVCDRLATC
ncbi:low affinity immunoglobulin epsilon Fc receptor isoform X2 [Zalophus californianus]|uniref:low affinity immunoglobulin epsilon Fc receptor isoform X2 n=1 Tax=Zalophus californianus TaxID=9704 RepID=UPI000F80EF04|nr:low affinity immunoglobulin epsilon Fc receptor isoform X2 [Zalophus californianus]